MAERPDEVKARREAISRGDQGNLEETLAGRERKAAASATSGRTENIEQMEQQIRQTRQETQKTWQSLRDKVSPRKFKDQAQERFRTVVSGRARDVGESAGQTVRDVGTRMAHNVRSNWLPTALVGIGVAWLVRESRSRKERQLTASADYSAAPMAGYYDETPEPQVAAYYGESEAWEEQATTMDQEAADWEENRGPAQRRAREGAEALQERSQNLRQRMRQGMERGRASARERYERVGEKARDLTHRLRSSREETGRFRQEGRQRTRQAQEGFWDMVDRNPLGMATAAFALGALVGLSIPEARKEHELMGPTRDDLLERADHARQEAMGKAREVAAHARDAAVEEARAQGLTPDDLKAKAERVSERVEETVKEDTRSAREEAKSREGSASEDFPGA